MTSTPQHIIADSGQRESFHTGMVRDTRHGKGRFDLVSPVAMRRIALVHEGGAAKYDARNWEKGAPLSRFFDSAKRHLNDYAMVCQYLRDGLPLEELPPEVNPNEDHLAQAAWNLLGLMHHEDLRPALDDMTARPQPLAVATSDNGGAAAAGPPTTSSGSLFERLAASLRGGT